MRVGVILEMTHDEVQEQIPYAMICETRFGSKWNTMRRKRLWAEQFTEAERKHASNLFKQSRLWYLVKGVPEKVEMTSNTLALWLKLADFCVAI